MSVKFFTIVLCVLIDVSFSEKYKFVLGSPSLQQAFSRKAVPPFVSNRTGSLLIALWTDSIIEKE